MKFLQLLFISVLFVSQFGCTGGGSSESGSIKDVLFYVIQSEPGDLNPWRSNDGYASEITDQHTYYHSSIFESLLKKNLDTYEFEPNLATSWTVSPDGKTFTFKLRKDVKFQDGSMMTAKDVKFSFDALFDDKYEAYVARAYYSGVDSCEVIDDYTVKFTTKKKYFLNLDILASLAVLPYETYSKQSETNRLAKTAIGSGAYRIKKWDKGKQITLEANPDWWGLKDQKASERYKFKNIVFKFIKEANLRQAMLERGKLDYEYRVREEQFAKKMKGPMWGKSVLKVKASNKVPKNLSYIGWNNDHKILGDRRVRVALSHLVNRRFLIDRFYYGLKDLATGPFRVKGEYANPAVKPLEFDPEKAKKILNQAGWQDTDKDGVLDKVIDGKKMKLSFNLLSSAKDTEKMLTTIKEDMKKAGVDMKLEIVDWNALLKARYDKKFDAFIMSWGGGYVHPDPTQIWHSKSAEGSGSNPIQYKNPEVDRLIDEGIQILDKEKRKKVYHKIHKLIAEDAPYTFLWEDAYQLYAVSSRVKRPKDTYNYSIGAHYWSLPAE